MREELSANLQRNFPKYFAGGEREKGTEPDFRRREIEIDLFWVDLLTKIAKDGAMSYMDLKALDVREFFIIVVNYEKSLNERINGNRKENKD